MCEVIEIVSNDAVVACWGDRCGKWSAVKKEIKVWGENRLKIKEFSFSIKGRA